MSQERDCLLLRLPPPLKAQIVELARANKRSATREIELAIERHVSQTQVEMQHA